jgi:hypothetical protein
MEHLKRIAVEMCRSRWLPQVPSRLRRRMITMFQSLFVDRLLKY